MPCPLLCRVGATLSKAVFEIREADFQVIDDGFLCCLDIVLGVGDQPQRDVKFVFAQVFRATARRNRPNRFEHIVRKARLSEKSDGFLSCNLARVVGLSESEHV